MFLHDLACLRQTIAGPGPYHSIPHIITKKVAHQVIARVASRRDGPCSLEHQVEPPVGRSMVPNLRIPVTMAGMLLIASLMAGVAETTVRLGFTGNGGFLLRRAVTDLADLGDLLPLFLEPSSL